MRRNLVFSFVGSAIVCLALAGVSQAAVPRAFVSTAGSDTNPCSAAQPCRSFNQALTVVDPGGEIVVKDPGGYSTGFTITHSVTIDAAGVNASVISTGATSLCMINTGPTDRVVLRGISFHGASVGTRAIDVTQVGSLYVEHCSVTEFTNAGVKMVNGGNLWVTGTDVRKCSTGVELGSFMTEGNLFAQDSRFTECGDGVAVLGFSIHTATGSMSNCTASLCAASGFRLDADTSGDAVMTLTNCRAWDCGSAGFIANSFDKGNVVMSLTNCRSVGNKMWGLSAFAESAGNATMRITNCTVTGNTTGILAFTAGLGGTASVIGTSPGTNLISGNGTDGSTTSSVTLQ